MSGADAGPGAPPSTPGARLRLERERRGLTQQQAAEQLNLDVAAIEAIEKDEFAALGAPVFARGHLRKYAAMLSLPEQELLEGYQRSQAQPSQPSLVPRARIEMLPQRRQPRWPWAVGSLLLFLLAAAAVAWFTGGAPGVPAFARRSSGAQAPLADGASTTPTGSPPAVTSAPAVPDAAPTPIAAIPGQVSLRMRFAADSWVEVYDASGKAVLYDLGRGGSERVVSGPPPLSVTLGNSPAVTVSVDGRTTAVPVPADGTVARFRVIADGSLH